MTDITLPHPSFFIACVLPSLTHSDSGALGFLDQQDGQWRSVDGLFQFLGGLALSQRPHWSGRRNTRMTQRSFHCHDKTNREHSTDTE